MILAPELTPEETHLSRDVATVRAQVGAALTLPTTSFRHQCAVGELADRLLELGAYAEAEAAYAALLDKIESSRTFDTFVLAKLTLGTLVAAIGLGHTSRAVDVREKRAGRLAYSLGIDAIERGGVSDHDSYVFDLVVEHLRGAGDEPPAFPALSAWKITWDNGPESSERRVAFAR